MLGNIVVVSVHPKNDGRIEKHIQTCKNYFKEIFYFRINVNKNINNSQIFSEINYVEYNISKHINIVRYLYIFTQSISIFKKYISIYPINIIHVHDPQSLIVGSYLKNKYASLLVYDRHEYWDHCFFGRHNMLIEMIYSKNIDAVACVTNSMIRNMPNYLKNKPTIHVPNFPDSNEFDHELIYEKIANVKVVNSIEICYFGYLDEERTKEMIPLLKRFSENEKINVNIGGRGPSADKIARICNKSNIIFHGEMSYEKIIKLTSISHFGFIFTDLNKNIQTSTNKLNEYFLSGVVPIAKIYEDGYSPEWPIDLMNEKSFDEIYAYVMSLIEDRDALSKKMTEIRKFGETRTWKACEKRYYDLYDRLVGR